MQPFFLRRLVLATGLMFCGAGTQAGLMTYEAGGVQGKGASAEWH